MTGASSEWTGYRSYCVISGGGRGGGSGGGGDFGVFFWAGLLFRGRLFFKGLC